MHNGRGREYIRRVAERGEGSEGGKSKKGRSTDTRAPGGAEQGSDESVLGYFVRMPGGSEGADRGEVKDVETAETDGGGPGGNQLSRKRKAPPDWRERVTA